MISIEELITLLSSVSWIPFHGIAPAIPDGGALELSRRTDVSFPPSYRRFLESARLIPLEWELYGLRRSSSEFDEENSEWRAALGNELTAFGTLGGDYGLAFRKRDDGGHDVCLVHIRRFPHEPSFEVVAHSFEEWAYLEVFRYWEQGVQHVRDAKRILDDSTNGGTLDGGLARLFHHVVMYWRLSDQRGRFLVCDEHAVRWWPQQPAFESIDPGYIQYWNFKEWTPAIPKGWRMCSPQPCKPAVRLSLTSIQRAAIAVCSARFIYGVLDPDRLLVSLSGDFPIGLLRCKDQVVERFSSFADFLRDWTRAEVQITERGLREVQRLLELNDPKN